jgi:DNA-binding transcriptional MerR regulator
MTRSVSEIALVPSREIELYEPAEDAIYTIDATAHLLDLPRRTIVVYCRHRLLSPIVSALDRCFFFDRNGIRALRRIEALRTICGDDLQRLQTRVRLLSQNNSGSKKETKPPHEKRKKGARPTKARLNKRRK